MARNDHHKPHGRSFADHPREPVEQPKSPVREELPPELPGAPHSFLVTARANAHDFVGGAFVIEPDDAKALPKMARGIWVGGAGDLAVRLPDDSTVVFRSVAAGTMMPVSATQVLESGTTATDLVGLR